ncbi:MAG: P83/100 family protein [Spirochaetales bacterium]|uniref:P83/100 family protein n=1 Tax=Candidatus Thalassospirochaeta sargassi TaxID=3119039 RepID=A0AAJ1IEI0_9SPIO|nr:P83/100 family protein [Spirochaetales bacterium]
MKKNFILTVLIILLLSTVVMRIAAETVYIDELQTSESDSIVFQNYSGPHNKIDTIEEIRGIGQFLGRKISSKSGEFTFFGKYNVIHAVDPNTSAGLDADIFILQEAAAVDHIINLRRMISGFLEEAYNYDVEQADLLAEFITVYNAVHRSDLDYFGLKYKPVVTKHLLEEKVGIALSYLEWPGKTMLIIPLTPQAGDDVLSDLDTDILSDEDVINQLRKDDDKGIDIRQDLVELKDEEVLEERDKIEEERDKIEGKEKELEQKRDELEDEVEKLVEDKTEDSEERIEKIKDELKDIEAEEEELAEEVKKLDEREEKVEEREDRIVEEREKIAEDQMKKIEEEGGSSDAAVDTVEKQPVIETVPFLKLSADLTGLYSGQLLLVDVEEGSIVKTSEVDSIRLRGYSYDDDEIISVAGSEGANRIVSLVRIDPETLEIIDSATAEVFIESAVIEKSGSYYAVVKNDGWKIGVFDNDLTLQSISDVEVFPATDIVISGRDIIAQNKSGRIIKIGEEDFSSPAF